MSLTCTDGPQFRTGAVFVLQQGVACVSVVTLCSGAGAGPGAELMPRSGRDGVMLARNASGCETARAGWGKLGEAGRDNGSPGSAGGERLTPTTMCSSNSGKPRQDNNTAGNTVMFTG